MTENAQNSVITLGDYAKPAEKLIDRISDAIGGVFAPWQIQRVAAAEAKAMVSRVKGEIDAATLQGRAAMRRLEDDVRHQRNLECVIAESLPYLLPGSKPEIMDQDWIAHFAQRAQQVSDKDMQSVWSRILAGESNEPGTFSKRTLTLVADLEKDDALAFQKLCAFRVSVTDFNDPEPMILDISDSIYAENGLDFELIVHLNSLGLIHYSDAYEYKDLTTSTRIFYFGSELELMLPKKEKNTLTLGCAMFTRFGSQLASICAESPVDGFFNYIHVKLKSIVEENRRLDFPVLTEELKNLRIKP